MYLDEAEQRFDVLPRESFGRAAPLPSDRWTDFPQARFRITAGPAARSPVSG